MGAKAKSVTVSTVHSLKKYTGLLLAAFAFLMFANTLGHGYNLDDELVTRKHKYTSKGLRAIGDIFTNPYYSDNMGYAYGYRPMVHLSFAVEHQFFGENPATGHFFNVLLFAILVMLFFRLLYLWMGEKGFTVAVLAAVLFAVHPVHTEVVASLKNRDEILALLFGLMAGIAATRAVRKNAVQHYALSAIWFVCALLSKKSMYPLVFIFPMALVLFENASLKTLLIFSILWVIPGAWIVADAPDMKMLLLLITPPLFSAAFITVYQSIKNGSYGFTQLKENSTTLPFILMGISLFTAINGYVNFSVYPVVFSIIAAIILLFLKPRTGLPFMALLLAFTGVLFQYSFWVASGIVLGFYHLALRFEDDEKKDYFAWIAVVVPIVLYWMVFQSWGNVIEVFILGILVFLFRKKKLYGLVFGLLVLIATLVFEKGFAFFEIVILWSVLAFAFEKKVSRIPLSEIKVSLLALVCTGFIIQWKATLPAPEIDSKETNSAKEIRVSDLQEGRKLEYVENTLTAPHTFAEEIGTGAFILGEYLRLMIFPYELSFYYGYAKVKTEGLGNPRVWISLLLHLGMVLLALWQLSLRPVLSLGIFWYLVSILLFSNWVELVAGMMAERLAFTASAGFCIAVASLFYWIRPDFSFRNPKIPEIVFLILVIGFGMRTLLRNTDWKDNLTLMGNDIEHLENSAQAHNLYALNLMASSYDKSLKWTPKEQLSMWQLAGYHFDKALQIWPEFFNAAYDKGRVGLLTGDMDMAIAGFEKAVTIDNKFMDPYYQLSEIYVSRGMYPQFLMNARRIFQKDKERYEKYILMARAHFLNNDTDSAKVYLRRGIDKYPQIPDLYLNMAEVFRAEGNTDSANVYMQRSGR
jgi:tetratricopeptide (TPR) repeat protein